MTLSLWLTKSSPLQKRIFAVINLTIASRQIELKWRAYSDGGGKDGEVTAIAAGIDWVETKRLRGAEVALTLRIEKLSAMTNTADRVNLGETYRAYLDSQASLKTIMSIASTSDQALLQITARAGRMQRFTTSTSTRQQTRAEMNTGTQKYCGKRSSAQSCKSSLMNMLKT